MLVGMSFKCQNIAWIQLHGSKPLYMWHSAWQQTQPGGGSASVSWSLFLLCLWQCRWPLMLEVFFNESRTSWQRHSPIPLHSDSSQAASAADKTSWYSSAISSQVKSGLMSSMVVVFWPQVSFCWQFPSAPADCTVTLTLASSSSMEEHLMVKELLMKPARCPPLMFLKESISI